MAFPKLAPMILGPHGGLTRLVFGSLLILACSKKADEGKNSTSPPKSEPSTTVPATRPGGTPLAAEPPPSVERKTSSAPSDFIRPTELGGIDPALRQRPVSEQQDYLIRLLRAFEKPDAPALAKLTETIHSSEWLSFGNPKIAEPALTQEECQARWTDLSPSPGDPSCRHRNMVRASDRVCIDQYEFPNVLCEYPVVWVRASEAADLCSALGKRLCDAHEWEGACAGEVLEVEPEYAYSKMPKGVGPEYRRARRILMEGRHNQSRVQTWAYGSEKNHALCATGSRKSATCTTVDYGICGTNDYPAGSFPGCHSKGGIYDQHGNVAEHMSFPLFPEELGGRGYTEMKGSWFLFGREETHPDDCRWRAKNWHTTKVSDENSHRNYHLGFRCCADEP
jgi:formylglycine-generating enzyme